MTATILNTGPGAWAFEEHAIKLSAVLWLDVCSEPAEKNYLLGWADTVPPRGKSFIPWPGIQIAADKRTQAKLFRDANVPMPQTELLETESEVREFLKANRSREWVLKYPLGCGASGHCLLTADAAIKTDWPKPYVVQEFIRLSSPEVYRLYCVDGHWFGWNARRFPAGVKPSPWVAHARGARYVHLGASPPEATAAAQTALEASGLKASFGVVDLIRRENTWLVLEIGTDGVANHVDRDFDSPALTNELDERLAMAFWKGFPLPWSGAWRRRSISAPSL
jgi:glutathione synthase/RimK-type ligase-like ATP-grasp enzyme